MANLNKQAKLQYFEKLSVDDNSKSFGKHVNRTSQITILIYKKICCLKRINFYKNKRMSLKLSINISDQLQPRKISLIGPKILKCHQGMTQ